MIVDLVPSVLLLRFPVPGTSLVLELGRPGYLALLVVLPLWWIVAWPRAMAGLRHSRGEWIREEVGGGSRFGMAVPLLPRVLRSLAIVLLVVALAEPHRIDPVEEISTRGRGLSIVVDLSTSMLARDMEEGMSRMDVARDAAIRFALARAQDEQSLVGFGREALTRVPPTHDPALIVAGVETLYPHLVPDGTDISLAILTAAAGLLESETEPRVVVLLTDGAHNGTGVQPLVAARALDALDVRVHAISILPASATRTVPGMPPSRTSEAAEMRTVLQGIADLTGGEYFHASTGAALDSIYAEVARIEAPIQEQTTSDERTPLRTWALALALLMIGVEGIVRGSRWGVVP